MRMRIKNYSVNKAVSVYTAAQPSLTTTKSKGKAIKANPFQIVYEYPYNGKKQVSSNQVYTNVW